jgi:hypothetical protein
MLFKVSKSAIAAALLFVPLTLAAQEAADTTGSTQPRKLTATEIIRELLGDPAIKNFVGPSENAWDFNTPKGVPGFEHIETKDTVAKSK